MENAIHMLKSVSNGQMNSFLVMDGSGHVIAVDGGFEADAEYFMEYLRELTGQEVPHLDAWILTHPHRDHFSAFMQIIEKYPGAVTFDRVMYNFPSVQFISSDVDSKSYLERFYRDLPRFADRICICSGGDKYDFGGMHIDVLCTADSELNMNVVNNSCLVFRLTMNGRKALFLGDCGEEEGDKLLRMHGPALRSDICQMAHHGQQGCKRDLYEVVRPSECIWCTPDWLWNNDAGKGYNTHCFKTIEVRGWMEQLGVKKNYVLKDGTQVIPM